MNRCSLCDEELPGNIDRKYSPEVLLRDFLQFAEVVDSGIADQNVYASETFHHVIYESAAVCHFTHISLECARLQSPDLTAILFI